MIFQDCDRDLNLCSQMFPNLQWEIDRCSPNRVEYQGESECLTIEIEGILEGYAGIVSFDQDFVMITTHPYQPELLAVLQQIKTEWGQIAGAMQ